ncbi:heme exporter protein CcmD [Xylophilus sp. ASV27]|uniref:heme exporter protein CcmD n=1 Tax=Xylophilus sp. ASV27 TaxID=2795129 RepID=UPI0018EAB058|nr:heme exporter protein CcmD [Xylophilus sp. ASV27]
MNWNGWHDFLAMGGYGLYVWGSFGVCALSVLLELMQLRARRRALAAARPGDGP